MGSVFFAFCALSFVIVAVTANGPVEISIEQRPEVVAILEPTSFNLFTHRCVGTILNNYRVLTSAGCIAPNDIVQLSSRFRAGSSSWKSGGTVYAIEQIVMPIFNPVTMVNDVAVIRATQEIEFTSAVQPGLFASQSYFVPDNVPLQSVGWTYLTNPPLASENVPAELRQQQLVSVNRDYCDYVYNTIFGNRVIPSMICSWPVQSATTDPYKCYGEAGGPLYHNGVVVGIRSFDPQCHLSTLPTVNSRVSSFTWLFE